MYMDKYLNENIFREYDIRGIVSTDFPDNLIYNIGKAFGTVLINQNFNSISISGDIRYTTDNLKKNLTQGLLDTGINVYDLGVLPTPVNYFSLFNSDIVNSIQITGSHNPSEYNGFKFSLNKKPFYGNSIQELKNIIKNNLFKKYTSLGILKKVDVLDKYNNYMENEIFINQQLEVVIDCGNAAACIVVPELFEKMNIKIIPLFCDIDPSFPNHHPDPTVDSNLSDLIDKVVKNKSDLGIAYDGDADRLIVVDDKGRIIRSDILLSLFVLHFINHNDSVVYDVKCSQALEDVIAFKKAVPVMSKTGHSIIKDEMIKSNAKIGGEMSGHIFFSDPYFGFDDAIYVSLRLLELISQLNKPLSELIDSIPKYESTAEIRLECINDKEKEIFVDRIVDYFSKNYVCNMIDGARIKFDKGWALVRASNTQPVIVFRFEADSKENLNSYKLIVEKKLKELCGVDVKF